MNDMLFSAILGAAAALLLLIVVVWVRRRRAAVAPPDAPAWETEPRPSLFEGDTLRLRGLLLLNLASSDGPDKIENAPPLGPRERVVMLVRDAVPGLEFDTRGRGEIKHGDHEVTIAIGADDPVATAVANAVGEKGIDAVRRLLVATGWRAYAARTGSFVPPDELLASASAKTDLP
jgi:hypothetical protein